MKILGIGETIIDNVFRLDDIDHGPTENMVSEKHIGGPIPAALIVLSRLGIDCTLMTSIGRDIDAKIIKKTLKHENVRLLHKLQKKTKVNTIFVNKINGDRRKLRGITIHPDIKNLDRKFIRQFDIILIDRHEKTAFFEIIEKKKTHAKVVIDPSIEVSPFTLEMIKLSDFPILPIESLAKIGVNNLTASLKELFNLSRKNIIITAGSNGSFIFDGQIIDLIPAYVIPAVDVTGAGDVYRGAFTYGVVKDWDIKKSATFGNFVAGLQCTKIGNIAAIPTKKEMQVFDLIYQRKTITMPIINDVFNNFISV